MSIKEDVASISTSSIEFCLRCQWPKQVALISIITALSIFVMVLILFNLIAEFVLFCRLAGNLMPGEQKASRETLHMVLQMLGVNLGITSFLQQLQYMIIGLYAGHIPSKLCAGKIPSKTSLHFFFPSASRQKNEDPESNL